MGDAPYSFVYAADTASVFVSSSTTWISFVSLPFNTSFVKVHATL